MKKVLLLVSLIVASVNIYATEVDVKENKVVHLGEKNIFAETGFETSLRSTTTSPFIVDAKIIEKKKYTTVMDILKDISGVIVQDDAINIRGQRNPQANVQVIIDGVVANILNTSMISQPFEVVNPSEIERIEVIPGGGAVRYGSGTAGGVINIITKKYKGTYGKVGFKYGSYKNKIFDIGIGTSSGPIDINLAYRNDKGNGYRREHDNHDTEYFDGKLKYNINEEHSLTFAYNKYKSEGESPDYLTKEDLKKDRRMIKVIKGRRGIVPGYSDYKSEKDQFTLNYNGKIIENNDLDILFFKQKIRTAMEDDKKGLKVKNKFSYGNANSFILGLGYEKNDMKRGSGIWCSKYYKKTYEMFGFNTYKYNNLEFTQGLRFEKARYSGFRKAVINAKGDSKNDYLTEDMDNIALNIGLNYLYSDTGNIYAKYERGFTSPTPTRITNKIATKDSYKSFDPIRKKMGLMPVYEYVFNDIKSEKVNTFEIGWNDYLLNSLVSTDIYFSETKDEIMTVFEFGYPNPFRGMKNVNLGKTRRYGFDLKAEQKFDKFIFTESYSYINAKIIKDKDENYKGKYLAYIPTHKFVLGVDYKFNNKFNIGLDGQYTSDYYLDNKNKLGKDGKKFVFNLRGNYEVINGLNIYLGINNLLNNKYNESIGGRSEKTYKPAPTRNYYAGFSYRF